MDGVDAVDAADLARQARRLSMWARVVLVPVAVIGAVLSYQSLYKAAQPTFGPYLAGGFPLLVDLLILGASLQYVAGAKVGRPMTGWRLTAHCGVVGTLVLNALAARELGEVPWHVTAPAVWAVLVELTGKQVLGQWRASQHAPAASIAPSLWVSSPIESLRTRLLMARTGAGDAHEARISVGTAAAAREALNLSLPRRSSARRDARRVRRVVNRQLRAGSLPPQAIMEAVGWTSPDQRPERSPESILRAVVQTILRPDEPAHLVEFVETVGNGRDRVVVLPDGDSLPPLPRTGWAVAEEPELRADLGAAASMPAEPAAEFVTVRESEEPVVVEATAPLPPVSPAASTPAREPVHAEAPTAPLPTAPLPAGDRGQGPLSMWAAAQVRTNGPASAPVSSTAYDSMRSRRAEPQDWADTNPSLGPVRAASPASVVSAEPAYGAWSPVPPYKPVGPVTPGADPDTAMLRRLDPDDEALDTGSMPTLSGRPTVKQKEERLAIAVRIVHHRPEITGAELRAELEREGWLVSDRTAARILGEARNTPPLRAVQG